MKGEKRDSYDDRETGRELHKLHDEWEHSPLRGTPVVIFLTVHKQLWHLENSGLFRVLMDFLF